MKVTRLTLAQIITGKTKSMPPAKLAKQIAAYLLSEGRTKELEALLRDVMSIRAEEGIVEAKIDSASQLNNNLDNQFTGLIKKLSPGAKSVVINHNLDKDLIGGFKLSLPNQQLDTSLRGKLNKFKQSVSGGAIR